MASPHAKRLPPKAPYKGAHWVDSSMRRLYLEDIVQIYDIMIQYAPHSPSFLKDLERYEDLRKWAIPPGTKPNPAAADFEPPKPAPTVAVEIDSAYLIETRDQFENYNPKTIESLEMRVNFFDLAFNYRQNIISVSRGNGDDDSTAAYDEIVGIVSRRIQQWPTLLNHGHLRNSLLTVLLALTALNLFFSNRGLAVVTFLCAASAWFLLMGWSRYWSNRRIVRLVYSDSETDAWKESGPQLVVALIPPIILAVIAWLASVLLPSIRP